jgi:hypothetical protein
MELIRKLLREAIEKIEGPLNQEYNDVFIEGQKIYPKLKILMATTKSDAVPKPRFFLNYPKNKGSYSLHGMKMDIAKHKIDLVINYLTKHGVKDIVKSISTNSLYFTLNNKKFRLSDHGRRDFEGVNIVVLYNSSPLEIINKIYSDIQNESN